LSSRLKPVSRGLGQGERIAYVGVEGWEGVVGIEYLVVARTMLTDFVYGQIVSSSRTYHFLSNYGSPYFVLALKECS